MTCVTIVQKKQCQRVKKNGYGKCHVDSNSLLKRIIAMPKIIHDATARKARIGTPRIVKGHGEGVPPPFVSELDIFEDRTTNAMSNQPLLR
jgi:hypothetical protein